jgi:hypothetical protein
MSNSDSWHHFLLTTDVNLAPGSEKHAIPLTDGSELRSLDGDQFRSY